MKIGFIGVGNMGLGMVSNLLANGNEILAYDTDEKRVDDLAKLGVVVANNVAAIAKDCEVVILCLPNLETSRNVIDQMVGKNGSLTTVIETSTLTPELVLEFENMLESEGIQFMSAPMIGGKNHAVEGKIEFLVEGSQEVYENNQVIFDAMGDSTFMGDMPSATLAKLAFNLSRYANLAVGVETHRLLEKYGANIPAIYEFMSEQSLDNFGQVWKEDLSEMMLKNVPYRPSQVPKKDLALLAEMAKSQGLDDELIRAIRRAYLTMEY